MKIKQQKDIKAFLDGRLDDDSARNLFDSQSRLLEDLISKTSGKSKNQKKTLQQNHPSSHCPLSSAERKFASL